MPDPGDGSPARPVAVKRPERFRVLAVARRAALADLEPLRRRGFDVEPHTRMREALAELEARGADYDLSVLEVGLEQMSAAEFLARAREVAPEVPVVVLVSSAGDAVAPLKDGAFNYLVRPFGDVDAVAVALRRAGNYGVLERRARVLEHRITVSERFETLVGASEAMRQIFATAEKLARSDVSVLLRGESGTGKELVARAIHDRSSRARGPFVALNCGAIPEALIDSELFGHTKGAFTGAVGSRPGVFMEASGGTLFLDEIGDIPEPVQLRLLRVLETHEARPVGGSGSREVDVRVIAATHVDLDEAVAAGSFRADLYYRLNVVSVFLPPLRERIEDMPLLAVHLLKKHGAEHDRAAPRLSSDALDALISYSWPGNVRELENAIQHALALVPGDEIGVDALPRRIVQAAGRDSSAGRRTAAVAGAALVDASADASWADELGFNEARKRAQDSFERTYMTRLLDRTQGNVSEAARRAGLDRSNFRRVLARLGIDPADHR